MTATYRRISKRDARKRFDAGQTIVVCPHKMRPGFPFGFHCYFDKVRAEEHSFDDMLREWAWYNATYETGYYAAFYLEEFK